MNFLAIDRMDLLGSLAERKFLITRHVAEEVLDEKQRSRLQGAIDRQVVQECELDAKELSLLAELAARRNLGIGECASMSVAISRGYPLGMDDKTARKAGRLRHAGIVLLRTQELVIEMVKSGVMTIAEADKIKADWEQNHRFKIPWESFAKLITGDPTP